MTEDQNTQDQPRKDAPNVIMLPPMLLLLHVIAGIVLDWALPLSMGHAWGWLGLILLMAALGITNWAKNTLVNAGTNVPPNMPALLIVTHGPFKYTRNPMYLCFMVVFVALALLADAPLMLLLALPLFYFLDQRVIVPEEQYLSTKFGEVYGAYKNKTRRWV